MPIISRFPCLSWEKNNVIKKIREEYPEYTDEVLMTVPGFYYDRTKKKIAFYAVKGIGMLIHDVYGRVAAIQIRRDTIKEAAATIYLVLLFFCPIRTG